METAQEGEQATHRMSLHVRQPMQSTAPGAKDSIGRTKVMPHHVRQPSPLMVRMV
jgi:hypothetical protein